MRDASLQVASTSMATVQVSIPFDIKDQDEEDDEDDEDDEDELPGDDEPRLRRRLVPTMVSSNTSSVSSSITFINNPMPGELRYINAVRSLEDRARNNTILGDDENDEEIDFNHP